MLHEPSIAVVIPCYNAASFLPEAIASIRAQDYRALSITVIDDGSTDNTEQVCRQWPDVTYLRQPNQGPSAARNYGVTATKSDFVAFLDADDLWTPVHLRSLLAPFEQDWTLEFAMGHVQMVELDPHSSGWRMLRERLPSYLIGSGLYHRKVFDRVGLFDPTMRYGEDLDWISRMRLANTPHLQVEETVLVYRKHPGGMTAFKSFSELNVMNALRKSLQRRRLAQDRSAA